MSFRGGEKRQFLRHLNFDVLTFLERSATPQNADVCGQQLQLDVPTPKKIATSVP
jgi:hypothetical protein